MAKVKLVKLILPQAEIEKLTAKDKKRYVMFTSMLRDLNLLQKCLCSLGIRPLQTRLANQPKRPLPFSFSKRSLARFTKWGFS